MAKAENAFELDQVAVRIDDEATASPKASDEERRPALLLDVSFTGSNDYLSMLHPSLKSALYQKRTKEPAQAELPGTEPNGLTERKFDFITKPIALDKEFTGYSIEVEYGFDSESNLKTDGVTIDNFKIKPLEGGSVLYQFRLGMHLDAETHGQLCQQKNESITISLTAPEAQQQELEAA